MIFEQTSAAGVSASDNLAEVAARRDRPNADSKFSSGAAATRIPGSAALTGTQVAPEDSFHKVSVEVVSDGYQLECDACDFADHLSDVIDADNLKHLHETFGVIPYTSLER
jgi:hypothetical protein